MEAKEKKHWAYAYPGMISFDIVVLVLLVVYPLLAYYSGNHSHGLAGWLLGSGSSYWLAPALMGFSMVRGIWMLPDKRWHFAGWYSLVILMMVLQLLRMRHPEWLSVAGWAGYVFGVMAVAGLLWWLAQEFYMEYRLQQRRKQEQLTKQETMLLYNDLAGSYNYHAVLVTVLAWIFWAIP